MRTVDAVDSRDALTIECGRTGEDIWLFSPRDGGARSYAVEPASIRSSEECGAGADMRECFALDMPYVDGCYARTQRGLVRLERCPRSAQESADLKRSGDLVFPTDPLLYSVGGGDSAGHEIHSKSQHTFRNATVDVYCRTYNTCGSWSQCFNSDLGVVTWDAGTCGSVATGFTLASLVWDSHTGEAP